MGILVTFLLFGVLSVCGQRIEGPVIQEFGSTFEIKELTLPINRKKTYKAVFEIADTVVGRGAVNPMVNTVARYLNMHAHAGIPLSKIKAAIVVHGTASRDVLNQDAYRKKFGVDNPNVKLLEALNKAGVEIILCGQTMHARGISKEMLSNPVKIALSAMTALIDLQDMGYRVIPF